MTILFFLKIALQMQIRDFSPELRFSPPAEIWKFRRESSSSYLSALACASSSGLNSSSSFFFFSSSSFFFLRMSSTRPAFSSSLVQASSEFFSVGSRLNFKDPLKRHGSYGMIVIASLTCWRLILLMSTPSILIFPPQISMILVRARVIVLLPAPVLPTTPTLMPP